MSVCNTFSAKHLLNTEMWRNENIVITIILYLSRYFYVDQMFSDYEAWLSSGALESWSGDVKREVHDAKSSWFDFVFGDPRCQTLKTPGVDQRGGPVDR